MLLISIILYLHATIFKYKKKWKNASVIQVNVTETDITRMASDYADNELELFRKTVNAYSQQVIYIYIYDVFIEHIPLNIHSAV